MNSPTQTAFRFFKVMGSLQAYLNLVYLLVAFPLGVFYFIFLVSGLSAGISLFVVWVGIPILLLTGIGWWALASFERFMAIHLLKEDVPAMALPPIEGADLMTRFKEYLVNPATWKSLVYLFLKFPLGVATFVILTTLMSLTLAFLTMPFTYEFLPELQVGLPIAPGQPEWRIVSTTHALLAAVLGLILWPVTLQVTNTLAWVHAKFAKVMLSIDPMGRLPASIVAE